MNSWLGHHDSATSALLILGSIATIAGSVFVGWAKKVIARPIPKPKP